MTISSQTRTAGPFTGNGVATGGPFTFKVFNNTDLVGVETDLSGNDRTLVYGTDFNVVLNADQNVSPGGTINYLIAGVGPSLIPTGYVLNFTSAVSNLQPVALTNKGGFFPKVINDALDRLTILVQQVLRAVNASLKFPLSDGTGLNSEIPNKTARANQFLGFDSNGNAIVGQPGSAVISPAMQPVVNAATVGAALIALGGGATGISLFQAANATTALTALGVSAFIQTLLDDANAGAARTTLGAAVSGVNNDITELTALTKVSPLIQGGLINKFRNANFDVWQRGVSGNVTTGTSAYTADGWIIGATGATAAWQRVQQGSIGNFVGTGLFITGATSMTNTFVRQRIEGTIAQELIGKPVTVQIFCSPGGSGTLNATLTVRYAGAIDNWSSPTVDVNAAALQPVTAGTSQILSYTFTPGANAKYGIEITWDFGTYLNSGSQIMFLCAADIRNTPGVSNGINNSPPTAERRSIFFETAFCQRYFSKSYDLDVAPGTVSSNGAFFHYHNDSTSATKTGGQDCRFPVSMRVAPSLTFYSPATGTSAKVRDLQNAADVNVTSNYIGQSSFAWNATMSAGNNNCTFNGHYTATAEL